MCTQVYFVRHAQPDFENHDDMTRALSSKGLRDRKLVTDFLSDKGVSAIFSSPYKRAVDTVMDFAEKNKLSVDIIDDFRERKISNGWIEDFNGYARTQWTDFDYKMSDGESLNEVQKRNISALNKLIKKYRGRTLAVGSHGTALSTIINYYDKNFSYAEFEKIKTLMPWIVEFVFKDDRCVKISSFDLFEHPRSILIDI